MTLDEAMQAGIGFHQQGRLADAENVYRQVLQQAPDYPPAMHMLGVLFLQRGQAAEAKELIGRAVMLHPQDFGAQNNLAEVHKALGEFEEALACARRSAELNPAFAPAQTCIGECLINLGRMAEAAAPIEKGVQLALQDAMGHIVKARYLLTTGQFKGGWAEFEWRLKRYPQLQRNLPAQRWTGAGKMQDASIVLTAEQGFGDVMQFVRYAPLLADRGAEVHVECHPELRRLMERVDGVAQVHVARQPLPRTDWYVPLPSLPLAFNTTLKTIPATVPYITPHPKLVEAWRELVKGDEGRKKVGIAWAGRRTHGGDRFRSLPAEALGSLGEVEGVSYYSLQKWMEGEAAPPIPLIDKMSRAADFADTAALVAQLDLVITADTAAAHLAGAMGKPVWVMLPFAPEWRWMLDRADSPWYPTMRLFRQEKAGDWAGVVGRVVEELRKLAI